jgi:hypothetical protein
VVVIYLNKWQNYAQTEINNIFKKRSRNKNWYITYNIDFFKENYLEHFLICFILNDIREKVIQSLKLPAENILTLQSYSPRSLTSFQWRQ